MRNFEALKISLQFIYYSFRVRFNYSFDWFHLLEYIAKCLAIENRCFLDFHDVFLRLNFCRLSETWTKREKNETEKNQAEKKRKRKEQQTRPALSFSLSFSSEFFCLFLSFLVWKAFAKKNFMPPRKKIVEIYWKNLFFFKA